MRNLSTRLANLVTFAFFMLAADSAFAIPPQALPEPGIFELLALGSGAALIISLKNRKKK